MSHIFYHLKEVFNEPWADFEMKAALTALFIHNSDIFLKAIKSVLFVHADIVLHFLAFLVKETKNIEFPLDRQIWKPSALIQKVLFWFVRKYFSRDTIPLSLAAD
jgi:hypothetical protein